MQAYGYESRESGKPYACILSASWDLSMTYLHLTRISGLLDVYLVLPDSRTFSIHKHYPDPVIAGLWSDTDIPHSPTPYPSLPGIEPPSPRKE